MSRTSLSLLTAAGLAFASASVASAADLAVRKAPVYAPPPVFSWTGFYIGGNVGAAWGTKEYEQQIPLALTGLTPGGFTLPTLITDGSHTVNGIIGGGTVGYNYQIGPTVWGIEFQGEGADVKGKGSCGLIAAFNCSTKIDGILTLAGRFGMTWDHTMLYVKFGGAWAHDKYDVNVLGLGTAFLPFVAFQNASNSDWRSGYLLGMGVEQAIAGGWSAKIEYDYMDFGTKSYTFTAVSSPLIPVIAPLFNQFDVTQRVHLIKFGVNYRFAYGAY